MRTALRPQDTIVVSSGASVRKFMIESNIGEGASCCVYEGQDIEKKKKVRIKELYPAAAQISRIDQELVWSSQQEKDAFTDRFERAANLQMQFANAEGTGNSTVHLDGIYDGNGTKYLIMEVDFGKTFAQDDSEDLHDILRSILALTKVIGTYHHAGFLHLDIKPENFLIVPETRERVIVFDTDTMVQKSELADIGYLSYTQKWAAPEQKMGRMHSICEATDIYAIGEVFFERIMGRIPKDDDMTPFANWEFSGPIFMRVNPAVKPKLKELFRRTLSAAVKRRYQSAEELAEALQDIIRITEAGRPYLISDYPLPGTVIGRDRELEQIKAEFENGTRAIFLHGFGGVGKTTLAKAYAATQEGMDYDAVVWLSYGEEMPLENGILSIPICAYSDDTTERTSRLERRVNTLREICKEERILFIIDNFDTNESIQDDSLNNLFSLPANFLITTRNDHTYFEQAHQIEVGCLDDKSLLELFELHSGKQLLEGEQTPALRMLHAVGGNTLFTTLLAGQLIASDISVETLSENLFQQEEKVRRVHNGKSYQLTQRDWLKVIWDISTLGEDEQETLQNVWLLQTERWDKQAYKELTGVKSLNVLNTLIEKNWVQWENTDKGSAKLSLHPLIEELVKFELKPQYRNCGKVAKHFDILLNNEQNYLREDILVPKHIFHAMAKWLSVEDQEEERERIFSKTCHMLDELLHGTEMDGETAFFHCFDENFTPDIFFAPLTKVSEKIVHEMKKQFAALDTDDEKTYLVWPLLRGRLNGYLVALQNHIIVQFLNIRFLSKYDYWMNEWGIWGDWDEEGHPGEVAPWDVNYTEIKKCIDSVTLRIAEYDQTIQYYFQTYFSTQEIREDVLKRYYFDDGTLILPETVIQWYWPIICAWGSVLEDEALETVITTDTGMLHRSMYELMRHTLEQFVTILNNDPAAQDEWGNYRELADSLVDNIMSIWAWRMEKSSQPNGGDTDLEIAMGVGYESGVWRSWEKLLSFQIPEFQPPEY